MGSDADRRRAADMLKKHGSHGTLSDVAFDRWFRHQVHRIYDETMAEPLPEDLMEVLERFPSRRASAHDEKNDKSDETKDDKGDGDERG